MRYLALLTLVLTGCFTTDNPIPIPQTQEQFEVWSQTEVLLRQEETKSDTLWMYSTGSFALFSIGLAIIAFSPIKRMAGLVFIAGGAIGMASVWVFDTKWFPWVAGSTIGIIILSALAFAWVNLYNKFISPSSATPEKGRNE